MHVGWVSELWRHPVKSMRGDRLASADVTEAWGVPGDRGWCVRDEEASEIQTAKQLTSLLQFHARYLDEPREGATTHVDITFPYGSVMHSGDANVDVDLPTAAGGEGTLWPPRRPADWIDSRRGKTPEGGAR